MRNAVASKESSNLDHHHTILIGVGADDHITHLNRPAEIAFGLAAETTVGQPFLECGIQWDWFEIMVRLNDSRRGLKSPPLHDVKYTRPDCGKI